jgi:alanyl-tRNA synthetase
VSRLKVEGARSQQGSAAAVDEAQFARGRFVAHTASGLGKDELRQLADAHRDRIKTGIVVIGSVDEGRVSLVVAVTKDLVPKVHAGNLVKELAPLVGGRGGGRPDFAEAGGNQPDQVTGALAQAKKLAESALAQ